VKFVFIQTGFWFPQNFSANKVASVSPSKKVRLRFLKVRRDESLPISNEPTHN